MVNGVPTQYPPTEMQYDSNGNLVRVIDPQGHDMVLTRRSDGVVTHIQDRRGFITTLGYNSKDNLTTITTPAGPGAAPARTTTLTYDDYDNVFEVLDPLSHRVETIFDNNDRPVQLTDARGKITQMNFQDGLLSWVEAPTNQASGSNRRKTRMYYDSSARVVQLDAQVGPDDLNDLLLRVAYDYTGFSQLRSLLRLANPTTIKSTFHQYDPQGRPLAADDFLGRTTQIFHEPFCVGNTVVTPRGVQRESSFDTLCRLVQLQTQEEIQQFTYDELHRLVQARVGERYAHQPSPFRVGGRYSNAVAKHDTTYLYDSLDRVVQILYPNGASVLYEYDPEGNVLEMTDVHGKVTTYTYYNDGRLHTLTFEGRTFTYSYDLAGRLETITYPSGSNLVASFTKPDNSSGWNENGQLVCLRYLKNGNHFHRFEYTYDDSGNRISLLDTPENTGQAVQWSYGYDWINRLTSVSRNSQLHSVYTYDESDNRTSFELPQADELWSYNYDALGEKLLNRSRSVSGGPSTIFESYTHDDDGNMTSRTQGSVVTEYLWNTHNRLRQVKIDGAVVDSTSYDHGGIRRLRKDATGVSKSYSSGGMSLCDTRPAGPISFIQGHQLLGLEESGNCYYFITDGLSSVRVVVDASCNAQGEFRYDEFGQQETSSQPPAALSAHAYVGGLGQRNEMAGLGLYHARHRWYASDLGRWLSADPIGFAGGLNLFEYANSSPTNLVDPSGLDGWDFARGVGKTLLAAGAIGLAVAASGVEIPAGIAWTAGSLAMGYGTCKLATGKEPFTGREIDVHEWDETLGSLVALPYVPPAGYKGAPSIGLNAAERLSVRGIPQNYFGGKFAIAAHGGGDMKKMASAILGNKAYRGQTVVLMSCEALSHDAPALQQLLRAKYPGANVEATDGIVATLFPFPLPFSLKPWKLAP